MRILLEWGLCSEEDDEEMTQRAPWEASHDATLCHLRAEGRTWAQISAHLQACGRASSANAARLRHQRIVAAREGAAETSTGILADASLRA